QAGSRAERTRRKPGPRVEGEGRCQRRSGSSCRGRRGAITLERISGALKPRSAKPRNKQRWFLVGFRSRGILNAQEASGRDDTKGDNNGRYQRTRGATQRSYRS